MNDNYDVNYHKFKSKNKAFTQFFKTTENFSKNRKNNHSWEKVKINLRNSKWKKNDKFSYIFFKLKN